MPSTSRPIWTGQLRLSLVSIPVQMFAATKPAGKPSFRQIHEPTGKPIHYQKVVDGVGPVDTDDIRKGFEYEKGDYVLLTDDEIDAVKLAIDPAGIDVHLAEILDLQALADVIVQRRQRAATAIFEDIAIIHLNQVGRIAARNLRGKTRPIIAPACEFTGNIEIRLDLLIGCYRLVGAVGALLRPPPQHAKARGLRLR